MVGGKELLGEVRRLLEEGKTPGQIRLDLEGQGFSGEDIALALDSHHQSSGSRSSEDNRNSILIALREFFDRVGYGATTPQFVNILFWLSAQTHPWILLIIGLLNGARSLLSVFVSNLLKEYQNFHRISKNTISSAGILFGFSFIVMAFALKIGSVWLFSLAFLAGAVGVVTYGDLYQHFTQSLLRKERMLPLLRWVAHWGVIITAISILISGYLLDLFPLEGVPVTILGKTMPLSGYLIVFEVSAFCFILAGYITSLLKDKRAEKSYKFKQFFKEHHKRMTDRLKVYWSTKYVSLLTLASIISGLLHVMITAFAGIAIYKIIEPQYSWPFFTLGIIYGIAIIASFTGPFFTRLIHRSTGLAPTLVFGTMLSAILPLALVFNSNVAAITAALSVSIIGSSITGFGQGLLAKKLMSDQQRVEYFQAQSYVIFLPYVVLVPVLAWIANSFPLDITFMIVATGLLAVVMPIYFILVVISQKIHL